LRPPHSFPTRRSSDLVVGVVGARRIGRADAAFVGFGLVALVAAWREPLVSFPISVATVVLAVLAGLAALRFLLASTRTPAGDVRSEEHTSELQSPDHL